jgi:hypothetical protein
MYGMMVAQVAAFAYVDVCWLLAAGALVFLRPFALAKSEPCAGVRLPCADEYVVMLQNDEPDRNIDELTDEEVYSAIRYLESHSDPKRNHQPDSRAKVEENDNGGAICVCLYIAILACLGFAWLYWR